MLKTTMMVGSMLTCLSLFANGEAKLVKSKVASIGLFKNGLAVVRRYIQVPENGKYMIEDVPEPVHGTFWIESDAKVTTRVTKKEFEVPENRLRMSLEETFSGQDVKVHLKENGRVISGKVMIDETDPDQKNWSRNFNQRSNGYNYGYYNRLNSSIPARVGTPYLTLKTSSGITSVDSSQILFIESEDINTKVKRKKPVLIFDVTNAPKKAGGLFTIEISYLTKGISWAPSYKIDLNSKNKMTIRQKAVIKNELMDFKDAEIHLISGFPNVKFANATSPMSLNTTWSSFFQQLNQPNSSYNNSSGQMLTQQAVMYNSAPSSGSGIDMSSMGKSEGVDIHYENTGKLTLDEGDSLAFEVAKSATDYESIIEWNIPDVRNERGNYISNYNRQKNIKFQDNIWDSIRFKNPLTFPMTTAAAIICKDNKFLGQTLSYWVNPTAETVLHVTKALSIRAQDRENEVKGKREIVWIAGNDYQKSKVEGKLLLRNYRKTAVKVLIKKRFSGELISADEKPECTLNEEGIFSVNERNNLIWEITLKPGEAKTLKYVYTLLVNI